MQKHYNEPFNVIDTDCYHAAYLVDGKIIGVDRNPMFEQVDSITIYDSMEEYKEVMAIGDGNTIKSRLKVNPLFTNVFQEIVDYKTVNLTEDEYGKLALEVVNIYDYDDMELTINKFLLTIGYNINDTTHLWERSSD